jgi:hypothetical protein
MFEVGDVVRFFSPTAGKEKFHLCIGHHGDAPLLAFLHLNSSAGYAGDCILDDGQIPGLPRSPTGKTVVSFSIVVRMGHERLQKFGAVRTGKIDGHLAGELASFAATVPALTRDERALVIAALNSLFF